MDAQASRARVRPKNVEHGLIDEPAHWLYVGVTQSGKTTLARWHARKLCAAKHRVLVYDPVGTETSGGDWGDSADLFADLEKFEKAIETETDAFVFVDESADVLSHAQTHNHWMPRRGRHAGLYFRILVQRVKMIPPNVRTQCARLFLFRAARSDQREILSDFGYDPDVLPEKFEKGDCLMCESGSDNVDAFNVFTLTGGDPNFDERAAK